MMKKMSGSGMAAAEERIGDEREPPLGDTFEGYDISERHTNKDLSEERLVIDGVKLLSLIESRNILILRGLLKPVFCWFLDVLFLINPGLIPSVAKQYIQEVIKADGLAAGKGVTVAMSLEEAYEAVDSMLVVGSLLRSSEIDVTYIIGTIWDPRSFEAITGKSCWEGSICFFVCLLVPFSNGNYKSLLIISDRNPKLKAIPNLLNDLQITKFRVSLLLIQSLGDTFEGYDISERHTNKDLSE
ncbi:Phosphoribosylamine--glycine ligase [Arachis hypogaea]|nr:Phosphoribosylamine--glycine ligase [Arachis hypogaea]